VKMHDPDRRDKLAPGEVVAVRVWGTRELRRRLKRYGKNVFRRRAIRSIEAKS